MIIDHHTLHYWWSNYWWVVILAWVIIGAAAEQHRERVAARRKHELAMAKTKLSITIKSSLSPESEKSPGLCRHRHVKSVRDPVDDKVIAWLCIDCDKQLPSSWSVYPEDL